MTQDELFLVKYAPGLTGSLKTPKLRKLIERSVYGPEQPEVVWRSHSGSTVTRYPSPEAAVAQAADGFAQRLDALAQRLDAEPSQAQRGAYVGPDIAKSASQRVAYGYMQPYKLSPRQAVRRSLGLP